MSNTLTRSLTLAAALASAFVVAGTAGASAHSIEQRQINQRLAIEHGRQTGSITWLEGRRLRAQQLRIMRMEKILKADGHLSPSDRRILSKMQDEARYNIVAEKTDGRRRLGFLPRIGN
jgi:hypothetical protein